MEIKVGYRVLILESEGCFLTVGKTAVVECVLQDAEFNVRVREEVDPFQNESWWISETKLEVITKFYTLHQNSSGGRYVRDDKVDDVVIIEAANQEHFEQLAEEILSDSIYGPYKVAYEIEDPEGTEMPTIRGEYYEDATDYEYILYRFNGVKERSREYS